MSEAKTPSRSEAGLDVLRLRMAVQQLVKVGRTKQQVAAAAGMSPQRFANILAARPGNTDIQISTLWRLAQAVEVDVAELVAPPNTPHQLYEYRFFVAGYGGCGPGEGSPEEYGLVFVARVRATARNAQRLYYRLRRKYPEPKHWIEYRRVEPSELTGEEAEAPIWPPPQQKPPATAPPPTPPKHERRHPGRRA